MIVFNMMQHSWFSRQKQFSSYTSAKLVIFLSISCLLILISTPITAGSHAIHPGLKGNNLDDCAAKLKTKKGGWCEIRHSDKHPSISSSWPDKLDKRTRMVTGPSSILTAWNTAAYDKNNLLLYFMGGGHADYGGNEVYRFNLKTGQWKRLNDPSPLNNLYILADYNTRTNKPWRRLCWMPDIKKVPGSSHTYDGLLFSHKTKTLFLYTYGPANGSCIEDKEDKFRDNPIVLGDRKVGFGWYEFNPSESEANNELAPLTWRKVFDYDILKQAKLHQSYPVSEEIGDGDIVFGSKYRTAVYDPMKPDPRALSKFTGQADWGDGLMIFDEVRKQLWSIHKKSLLSFSAVTGKLLKTYKQVIPHAKSLAINNKGELISWNGGAAIYTFNPDAKDPKWQHLDWGEEGPRPSSRRVYGKWVYIKEYDLFAGIANSKTGVWIYKHPEQFEAVAYESRNLQDFLKNSDIGEVTIKPGIYGQGLYINKSMEVNLQGVSLRGVARGRAIINVNCDGCEVVIRNADIDGTIANCLFGNCAGIKAEGKGFRLRIEDSRISNTVIGIMTDNRGGRLELVRSLIENTGLNDRSKTLGHGFYAGDIDEVVVRDSVIRRSFGKGHLLKSRASTTHVTNTTLAGLDGLHSRIIDFPCGGELKVTESILQQGEQTDNNDLFSVGTEPEHCGGQVAPSSVVVKNNWIIIERDRSEDERAWNYGDTRLFTWRAPIKQLDVTHNRIIEPTGRLYFINEEDEPVLDASNTRYHNRKEAKLGNKVLPDSPPGKSK